MLYFVIHTANGIIGQAIDILFCQKDFCFPHKHFAAASFTAQNKAILNEMDFKAVIDPHIIKINGIAEIARYTVNILTEQDRHFFLVFQEGQDFFEFLADFCSGTFGKGKFLDNFKTFLFGIFTKFLGLGRQGMTKIFLILCGHTGEYYSFHYRYLVQFQVR